MPRQQRVLSETGIYHVMMRGNERKNLFQGEEDKQRFLETLFGKKEEAGFSVYAYCLMDNHIHLLIKEGRESLATTMKRINTSYAYYFNQKYNRVGHLFQGRFKSEPVEDDRYLMAVARYIHNNPVKAGMVDRLEQYRWSSYRSYLAPDKAESRNVDTELILSFISLNHQEAVHEFICFSMETDQNNFLDINNEVAWTLEDGKLFLAEYLNKEWPGSSLEKLMLNPETRNEIVAYLRGETNLSVRKIAGLLGINRGSVQYIKANNKPKP